MKKTLACLLMLALVIACVCFLSTQTNAATSGTCGANGDNLTWTLDGNRTVNEDDAIYLLQHMLMPDLFEVSQPVNFDGNGFVNEDDVIFLLQHVLMPDIFPLK